MTSTDIRLRTEVTVGTSREKLSLVCCNSQYFDRHSVFTSPFLFPLPTSDRSVVKLAPHSFRDPFAYLDREETEEIIEEYTDAILRVGNFDANIFQVHIKVN